MYQQCSIIKHCFYIISTFLKYIVSTLFVHGLWWMLKSCSINVFNNVPTMFKQCSLIKTLFLHCFYIFTIHFFYTVATLFVHCLYMFCDEGWNHVQSMYSIMFQQCSNNVVLLKHCFYIVSTYLLYIFSTLLLHCLYIVCTCFVMKVEIMFNQCIQ